MNKPSVLRTIIVSVILCAAMNLLASCDSCDRKESDETSTGTMETEDGVYEDDTLNNDHASGDSDTGFDTPTSNIRSTDTGTNGTGNTTGTTTGGNTRSSSNGTENGDNSTGYGDSNSPIENSSTSSVRNGRPVQSGGTSGSGMGTGTGSTGNNSKVTRPEDQRN